MGPPINGCLSPWVKSSMVKKKGGRDVGVKFDVDVVSLTWTSRAWISSSIGRFMQHPKTTSAT